MSAIGYFVAAGCAALRRALVPFLRNGKRGHGAEPFSHPAIDAERGSPGSRSCRVFCKTPRIFLWTILVGNTVVNFVIFSLGFLQLQRDLGHRPVLEGAGFLAGSFSILHRLRIGAQNRFPTLSQPAVPGDGVSVSVDSRDSCRRWWRIVAWFSRGFLRWTGGRAYTGRLFGSRDELRFVMQEAAPDLTREEKAMINRVLDLPNRRVRHVMVPMANVTMFPGGRPDAPGARCLPGTKSHARARVRSENKAHRRRCQP